ncbi:hypothetical protein [Streptomyces sp. WAC 04229]|uniref:hypothetical protein n=1 Tax=Streptomyces sp. WAC 04229 TaxID=2203206 RepID=UPI003D71AEBA
MAHGLSSVHSIVHWPLMALILLWLGRRHQTLYVRTAFALLLSSGAGFAVLAGSRLPADETSLVSQYVETPGTQAGWYTVMALALVTAVPALWARAIALAAALVVASVAHTADNWSLSVLLAGVLPVTAWYATVPFLLRHRPRRARRRAPSSRLARRAD